jgi:apolipoprotein N-acyltransferase
MIGYTTYRRAWVPSAISVITTALLYYFGTGLSGIGWLVFMAPLPVLVVSQRLSLRSTLLVSFFAYFLGQLNIVPYFLIFAPPPIVISITLLSAILFAAAVALFRAETFAMKSWLAVFVFPVLWTSFEFIQSLLSPNGTAGSIAYTQTNFPALIQIASITGLWGVTFIVALIPAALAVVWKVRDNRRNLLQALIPPVVIVASVLIFGWIRLSEPRPGKPVFVGLAATDTTVKYFRSTDAEKSLSVVHEYAGRASDLAKFGAKAALLPEKFTSITKKSDSTVYSIFAAAARQEGIVIIAGLNYIADRADTNVAAVFLPDGRVLSYDKRYLVPGFEARYFSGDEPLTFKFGSSIAGVEICKDMDFQSWSRRYGRIGVNILFVPAWDFTVDGELHMDMAVMRGVENGFSIVRCAQQGLLTVSDYRGEIIAKQSSSSSPEVLLLSSVSPGPGGTLYSRLGDWFGWLSVVVFLFLIGSMISGRRRRKRLSNSAA